MTIKEALTSTVAFTLPANRIEKALIDAGLPSEDVYSKANEKDVDLAMLGLLFTLLTVADLSEDDVSVKLPSRDVLLKAYAAICEKWGVENPLSAAKPIVRQRLIW